MKLTWTAGPHDSAKAEVPNGGKFVVARTWDRVKSRTYMVMWFGPGKADVLNEIQIGYAPTLEAGKRKAERADVVAARSNPRKAVKRPTVKRNPLSWAYEAGLAKSRQIGIDNAESAIDQRKTYPSVRAAYAAYIVNAIDTVTEHRLPGREAAVQAFLDHVAKPRKRRK